MGTEPMHRILVCEENDATRTFLADNLTADGFDVEVAADFIAAKRRLLSADFDVVLCDLNGDTRGLVGAIREAGEASRLNSSQPIIVLGGDATDEMHRTRVLDLWHADDVVAKPFSYPELRARVAALLRRLRGGELERKTYTVGDGALIVHVPARRAILRGVPLELTRVEWSLLVHMAPAPERVFTKEELLRDVWGFQSMGSTRTAESHARHLRKKMLAVDPDGFWMESVRGVGWRLLGWS